MNPVLIHHQIPVVEFPLWIVAQYQGQRNHGDRLMIKQTVGPDGRFYLGHINGRRKKEEGIPVDDIVLIPRAVDQMKVELEKVII